MGQSPRRVQTQFSVIWFLWILRQWYLLPAMMCDKEHRLLSIKEFHPSLWWPEVLWGLDYILLVWLAFQLQPFLEVNPSLQVPWKWEVLLCGPKTPVKKTFDQAGCSGSLRNHLPVAQGKDPSLCKISSALYACACISFLLESSLLLLFVQRRMEITQMSIKRGLVD